MHIDKILSMREKFRILDRKKEDIAGMLNKPEGARLHTDYNSVAISSKFAKVFIRIIRDEVNNEIEVIKQQLQVNGIEIEEKEEKDIQKEKE